METLLIFPSFSACNSTSSSGTGGLAAEWYDVTRGLTPFGV